MYTFFMHITFTTLFLKLELITNAGRQRPHKEDSHTPMCNDDFIETAQEMERRTNGDHEPALDLCRDIQIASEWFLRL